MAAEEDWENCLLLINKIGLASVPGTLCGAAWSLPAVNQNTFAVPVLKRPFPLQRNQFGILHTSTLKDEQVRFSR